MFFQGHMLKEEQKNKTQTNKKINTHKKQLICRSLCFNRQRTSSWDFIPSAAVTNSLCNLQQIPLLHLCKILVMNLRFVKCWGIHRWKALYKLSVINVIHSVKWNLCWAKYCSVKFIFKVTCFTAPREWRLCHCFQHINYI